MSTLASTHKATYKATSASIGTVDTWDNYHKGYVCEEWELLQVYNADVSYPFDRLITWQEFDA